MKGPHWKTWKKWNKEEKKRNRIHTFFFVNLDLFHFTSCVHFNCYLNMFLKKEDYNFFLIKKGILRISIGVLFTLLKTNNCPFWLLFDAKGLHKKCTVFQGSPKSSAHQPVHEVSVSWFPNIYWNNLINTTWIVLQITTIWTIINITEGWSHWCWTIQPWVMLSH